MFTHTKHDQTFHWHDQLNIYGQKCCKNMYVVHCRRYAHPVCTTNSKLIAGQRLKGILLLQVTQTRTWEDLHRTETILHTTTSGCTERVSWTFSTASFNSIRGTSQYVDWNQWEVIK